MTKTIGVIPAGGNAERFNGIAKEMLPISADDCALTRCIKSMKLGGADEIWIATRQEKISEIFRVVGHSEDVLIRAQVGGYRGLWEVVAAIGESEKADWYYFAMPDTVYPVDVFMRDKKADASCGVFWTDKPHRFGVVSEGRITDKPADVTGTVVAWGVWIWSAAAMDVLAKACRETQDFTAALNVLIQRYPVDAFLMPYYYDFAAFEDYREFICQSI